MSLDNLVLYYVREPELSKDDLDDLQKQNNGRVRRPPSPFFFFLRRNLKLIRTQQPTLNGRDAVRLLGVVWKSLPKPIKDLYLHCSMQLKLIHSQLYPDFSLSENKGKRSALPPLADTSSYGWLYLLPMGTETEGVEPVAAKRARLAAELKLQTDLVSNRTLLPFHKDINTAFKTHASSNTISSPITDEKSLSKKNVWNAQMKSTSTKEIDIKPPRSRWLEALLQDGDSNKKAQCTSSPKSTPVSEDNNLDKSNTKPPQSMLGNGNNSTKTPPQYDEWYMGNLASTSNGGSMEQNILKLPQSTWLETMMEGGGNNINPQSPFWNWYAANTTLTGKRSNLEKSGERSVRNPCLEDFSQEGVNTSKAMAPFTTSFSTKSTPSSNGSIIENSDGKSPQSPWPKTLLNNGGNSSAMQYPYSNWYATNATPVYSTKTAASPEFNSGPSMESVLHESNSQKSQSPLTPLYIATPGQYCYPSNPLSTPSSHNSPADSTPPGRRKLKILRRRQNSPLSTPTLSNSSSLRSPAGYDGSLPIVTPSPDYMRITPSHTPARSISGSILKPPRSPWLQSSCSLSANGSLTTSLHNVNFSPAVHAFADYKQCSPWLEEILGQTNSGDRSKTTANCRDTSMGETSLPDETFYPKELLESCREMISNMSSDDAVPGVSPDSSTLPEVKDEDSPNEFDVSPSHKETTPPNEKIKPSPATENPAANVPSDDLSLGFQDDEYSPGPQRSPTTEQNNENNAFTGDTPPTDFVGTPNKK